MRTWRSLQRQTYADWEWVIVDDHSSDQSTLEALWEAVDRRDLHCSPTPLLHGRRVLPFGSLKCTTLPEVISPMSTDTALIESGLLAAGLPDAEIAARVADIGPDIVAEAMLA